MRAAPCGTPATASTAPRTGQERQHHCFCGEKLQSMTRPRFERGNQLRSAGVCGFKNGRGSQHVDLEEGRLLAGAAEANSRRGCVQMGAHVPNDLPDLRDSGWRSGGQDRLLESDRCSLRSSWRSVGSTEHVSVKGGASCGL